MTFPESITVAELEADPYPIYARLRREAPVAYVPAINSWLATRWEDVMRVADDAEAFEAWAPPIDAAFGTPNILGVDGPLHKELRATLHPTLRPAAVAGYIEHLVAPIAAQRLEAIASRDAIELVEHYFEPVSVRALGIVMGLADLEDEVLQRWFHGLAEGATNFERDPAKQAAADATLREIDRHFDTLLSRLEAQPDDSLISHMLHVGRPPEAPRARDQIVPSLKVILLGGMQEPGHGAATTLLALLDHPDQLQEVLADRPRLLPAAIEEAMRLVAPIGTQGRRVTRDLELGGARLQAGDFVSAVLASANRDETRFEHPERFDVHRPSARVATFGFGRHFCSGHAFARAVERISLDVLLAALPGLHLDAPPIVTGWEFRAPRRLVVRW